MSDIETTDEQCQIQMATIYLAAGPPGSLSGAAQKVRMSDTDMATIYLAAGPPGSLSGAAPQVRMSDTDGHNIPGSWSARIPEWGCPTSTNVGRRPQYT